MLLFSECIKHLSNKLKGNSSSLKVLYDDDYRTNLENSIYAAYVNTDALLNISISIILNIKAINVKIFSIMNRFRK
jgi:hypothetical protein